jgi:hypothetical protein
MNINDTEVLMAKAIEVRQQAREIANPGAIQDQNCRRCGGLMVGEFCLDLLNGTGELEFLASRCVQCGEIIDPVILQNRKRQHETMLDKALKMSIRSVRCQVAA